MTNLVTFAAADPRRHLPFIAAAQAQTAAASFGRLPTEAESGALTTRLVKALSDPRAQVITIERETETVGYYWLEMRPGKTAFLIDIFVSQAVRRRGMGSVLLSHAIEHARNRGATEFRLAVAGINDPARRLFDSSGFAVSDWEIRDGRQWFELRQDLSRPES